VSNDVVVTVTGSNDAPIVAIAIVDQVSDEDTAFSFTVPAGTFSDAEGDTLTLTATLANDTALPAWLLFDGTTFTGTPPLNFDGALDVKVTASDGVLDVSEVFNLDITNVNDTPTLSAGIGATDEDSTATVDLSVLGADIDSDDDGTTLIYSVPVAPSEGTATISGTSLVFDPGSDFQDLGDGQTRDITITVQATDAHGASVSNDVVVTVTGIDNNDVFTSTTADESFIGGVGNDTFVFAANMGNDVITDFTAGAGSDDVVELQGLAAFDTYAEVLAAAVDDGTNTTITIDADNSIVLNNVLVADLHQDDFKFI
jgi:hypothetical protein